MNSYFRFLAIGLVLALYTEALLKLVAGIKPSAFGIAVLTYPFLLTFAFISSAILNRVCPSRLFADLVHYIGSGIFGLAFEWILLGNGPQSNAFQPGMFAMWTTFLTGPRILIRLPKPASKARKTFWVTYAALSAILLLVVILAPTRDHKVVFAVYGLSGTYMVWSIWLVALSWWERKDRSRSHRGRDESNPPAHGL